MSGGGDGGCGLFFTIFLAVVAAIVFVMEGF
jgi:hypothetical protein